MDIGKTKEDLSVCYLETIAAANGIALERINHDEDSIDVIIKKIIYDEYKMPIFNSQISLQLKATSSVSQYKIDENYISYALKVKNYNDLCVPASMPSILALLLLPENKEEWVTWTPDELIIKGKMYWLSLQGHKTSDNNTNITVKIPKNNILNAMTIQKLIEKVAREGVI